MDKLSNSIEAVSPSPDTPRKARSLLTMFAPVVTEGILPCTVLNPETYPGSKQGLGRTPIPDILAIVSSAIPFSQAA